MCLLPPSWVLSSRDWRKGHSDGNLLFQQTNPTTKKPTPTTPPHPPPPAWRHEGWTFPSTEFLTPCAKHITSSLQSLPSGRVFLRVGGYVSPSSYLSPGTLQSLTSRPACAIVTNNPRPLKYPLIWKVAHKPTFSSKEVPSRRIPGLASLCGTHLPTCVWAVLDPEYQADALISVFREFSVGPLNSD